MNFDIDYIYILDLIGVVAFAVSGVLAAIRKRMDLFGLLIIAFSTAIGGGTLRDLLIGVQVVWVQDITYVYVIVSTTVIAIILRNKLDYLSRSLFFFDTIGISIFTLIGLERALEAGFHPIICIATGTITACFGGISRDVLTNQIPIIFHKEIYATACILGGVFYFLLHLTSIPNGVVYTTTFLIIFTTRSLAVYFDLHLPSFYPKNKV